MKAYSDIYLYDAVRCIAEFMDYGVNECGIDAELLFDRFIGLGYAEEFGKGNLKYVTGMSGQEIAQLVIDEGQLTTNPKSDEIDSSIYWCGWILAYYQWSTGIPFKEIIKYIDFNYLRKVYPSLHTASEEKAVEVFSSVIKDKQVNSRIQSARMNYGYSQSELSVAAGINLRTLQEYESKRRDINKASGSVLFRIARVLCCNIEDILEFEL